MVFDAFGEGEIGIESDLNKEGITFDPEDIDTLADSVYLKNIEEVASWLVSNKEEMKSLLPGNLDGVFQVLDGSQKLSELKGEELLQTVRELRWPLIQYLNSQINGVQNNSGMSYAFDLYEEKLFPGTGMAGYSSLIESFGASSQKKNILLYAIARLGTHLNQYEGDLATRSAKTPNVFEYEMYRDYPYTMGPTAMVQEFIGLGAEKLQKYTVNRPGQIFTVGRPLQAADLIITQDEFDTELMTKYPLFLEDFMIALEQFNQKSSKRILLPGEFFKEIKPEWKDDNLNTGQEVFNKLIIDFHTGESYLTYLSKQNINDDTFKMRISLFAFLDNCLRNKYLTNYIDPIVDKKSRRFSKQHVDVDIIKESNTSRNSSGPTPENARGKSENEKL